jgi:hypothetical protein
VARKEFFVKAMTRRVGAMGIFELRTFVAKAETEKEARHAIIDSYSDRYEFAGGSAQEVKESNTEEPHGATIASEPDPG